MIADGLVAGRVELPGRPTFRIVVSRSERKLARMSSTSHSKSRELRDEHGHPSSLGQRRQLGPATDARLRSAPAAAAADRVSSGAGAARDRGSRGWTLLGRDSPGRLRQAFGAIADAMGHRYVLSYEPTGVRREGWHRIEARLRGVKGDVHVRRGYWVGRD